MKPAIEVSVVRENETLERRDYGRLYLFVEYTADPKLLLEIASGLAVKLIIFT
jgi:hypothetical protein